MSEKRALVTGASEGIGRAFAHRLAREGYRITGVARNEARLAELTAALGAGHEYLVADLSRAEDVARIAAVLSGSRHDLLVNNAGYGLFGRFPDVPLPRHEDLMRVNMSALVALTHAFLGQAEAGDALVNVSSGLALAPMPASGLYAASKAFVTVFSECLWYEQRAHGVYVMGLHPGPTSTEFQRRAGASHHEPPAALVQTAEALVEQAMAALRARKVPTVIAGTRANRLLTFMNRLRSRKAIVEQMGKMFPE